MEKTRPSAGKSWTDSGEAHDRRGLKQRSPGEVRVVPLPLPLVWMLHGHVVKFDTVEDGRIFASERGNMVASFLVPPDVVPGAGLGLVAQLDPFGAPGEPRGSKWCGHPKPRVCAHMPCLCTVIARSQRGTCRLASRWACGPASILRQPRLPEPLDRHALPFPPDGWAACWRCRIS